MHHFVNSVSHNSMEHQFKENSNTNSYLKIVKLPKIPVGIQVQGPKQIYKHNTHITNDTV